MERDFMGLNSKESLVVVKEEVNCEGYKEIGFTKRSGIQWPFSNKVSAVPQLMNFNFAQGDKIKKIGSDALVSPGFMPISTADAAEVQKSFNHNGQGGSHFSLTACSVQHDLHPVQCPYDVKMFPVSNQAVSVSVSNPFMKNHFATAGLNLPVTSMKPQLLGGIPVTTPHSILPTLGSVVGSIEPWKSVKASGSPAQLTIFYAGTVNVYEDITPEKAQAIMYLAQNGSSVASSVAHPKVQVQTPISKPVQVDSVPANQLINTQLSSGLSSPLSVSSHNGAQSRSGSTTTDEVMACKSTGTPTTPISKMEPPKMVNTMGSVAATSMMPSVPQARKASLARFLEKRKERVMSAAPYNLSKKFLDCATLESNA
ncbi:PREDICTED: protein TIFY 6B [Theobroma cacao]|uniref:Protein TIFY n=1 Tax=Theobroma cacao TaxID=3641 RepID=A0AB32VGA4_THECC|nr:PREDICTED: protein TIFY 6B [Theobroma cacao]